MDAHNLATVIAPNILKEKTDKTVAMDDSSFLGIEAVNLLLDFNDEMCEVNFAFCRCKNVKSNSLISRFQKISSPS